MRVFGCLKPHMRNESDKVGWFSLRELAPSTGLDSFLSERSE
jgi:hypothetical protein